MTVLSMGVGFTLLFDDVEDLQATIKAFNKLLDGVKNNAVPAPIMLNFTNKETSLKTINNAMKRLENVLRNSQHGWGFTTQVNFEEVSQ